MNGNEDKNKIERANEALYSKVSDGIFSKKRHSLKESYSLERIPSEWKEEEDSAPVHEFQIPYQKIFLGALIFFVLAIGIAAYKFLGGTNVVSGGNIDVLITGPVSISGGEVLPMDIEVKNNNSLDLKVVDLRVDFPAGTKDPTNLSKDLTRYTQILGDITVGQSAKSLVKAVIFGQENTQEVIKVTIEYRLAGSNAIFSKEKDYTVLLSSSPINIAVTGPDQINANQNADFAIKIKSNSLSAVGNLILKVGYPFGFNVTSANPKPSSADGSVFSLGDLAPGAEVNIRISGIFQGQSGEERVLTFNVGNPANNDRNNITTPFASFSKSISLNRPSVGLSMLINQSPDKEVAVDAGSRIASDISWQNNLAENIYNMVIKINLTGSTIDKNTMNVSNGYYNSSDNSITFDKSQRTELGTVSPNAEGSADFNFQTLSSLGNSSNLNNSQINMNITVTGTRSVNGISEILFTDSKILKISSYLKLLSLGYRTSGPFENSGPFPPRVDNESTYTITWTATNSWNDVSGEKVIAILPPNVKWTGYTSPDSEKINYDSTTGQIVWDIGDMRANNGSSNGNKSVSFQVSITPSISDLGKDITLLNEAVISGTDAFSGARIGETRAPVTTNITSDPQYSKGVGEVVQ